MTLLTALFFANGVENVGTITQSYCKVVSIAEGVTANNAFVVLGIGVLSGANDLRLLLHPLPHLFVTLMLVRHLTRLHQALTIIEYAI